MNFPLLLAGPVLRRVEPALVSVWLALRERANVTLKVWEGRAESGRADVFAESEPISTLRVGAALHIAQVTVRIPDTAGKSLQPDALYSYDVLIVTDGGAEHTLESLGLLENGPADRETDGDARGSARLALGFEPGLLPSFAPPPSELRNLSILYGSCRRPGFRDPDALALVDDLIFGKDLYKNPRARPHQLFLGGDQIYADDVALLHMLVVMERGMHLIGVNPTEAPSPGVEDPRPFEPIEYVPLDRIKLFRETGVVDPLDPAAAYDDADPTAPGFDPNLPVDRFRFPEGRRKSTIIHDAQMTTEDGESHMISLGDFAALYLTVWSNALWGAAIPGVVLEPDPKNAPGVTEPILWNDDRTLPEDARILVSEPGYPNRIAGNLYASPKKKPKVPTPEEVEKAEKDHQKGLRGQLGILRQFHKTLPKVQRALANVPTYMILDDHDVTDDFFLNPMWRDRVLTTRLGQAIMRNAMLAYALFQDWGNDPPAYLTGPKAELLSLAPQLFPQGLSKGPQSAPADRMAVLFGHDLRNQPTADGRYASVKPPLLWHFMIDGPKHRVVALDNRTRRSYASRNGPPGNVSAEALADQIPLPPLPAGREILIVVAPLQVIGPPVLDDLVAPLSYRLFDTIAGFDDESNISATSDTGLRGMVGTNPDAIEAWTFDAPTFEHLLERLEPYGRVVLLSGDVHYSAASLMSYWRGAATQPAGFAQFTSSGFKNVMPPHITVVDRSIGFAQQMVRANLGTERLGWDQPLDDIVRLPPGRSEQDLVPAMRSRMQSVPVLLPTWGWPVGDDPANPGAKIESSLNPDRPPDWRWRVTPLLDERLDGDRPKAIRLLQIDDAEVAAQVDDPSTVLQGYRTIAARHQHALGRLRNARQFLFRSNVGRVTFDPHDDGTLDALHQVFTTFTAPDDVAPIEPEPVAVMVQIAPLGPEPERPPERLREHAIEPVEPGVA